MSRLSFSIAINLLTENFRKGTNSVKAGFKAMQMQVLTFAAALGAGSLGLSNFISRLIDTARETARVTTALKNVSGGMLQFAENQRFLLDIAKKYGLEINSLTGNFAKFTASATNAGVTMENQKKIFEAVSRANTAFSLSADKSNGVMLALSQMMGKGKISSEELRKQMGEKLPIAMAAMAKAAGTTIGGLEKLLKQGKLMSADVLPKFADALNEMLPDVDTDNLETSINRLKNTFTEFVSGLDIQSKYKSIIDWLIGQVQSAASNIKNIVNTLVSFIIGTALGKLFKWIATELAKAQRQAMITASRSAKAAGQAFDQVAWKAQSAGATMRVAFERSIKAIRAAFMTILPTAVFTVVASMIAKIVSLRKEAERIRNLYHNYQTELSGAGNTQEISRLEKLKKLADNTEGLEEKKKIWSNIGSLMGEVQSKNESDLDYQNRINNKLKDRIELLKSAAEIDYLYRKKLETEDQIKSLNAKVQQKAVNTVSGIDTSGVSGIINPWSGPFGVKTLWNMFNPWNGLNTTKNESNSEVEALTAILNDVNKRLDSAETKASDLVTTTITGDEDEDKAFKPAQEKYTQSLAELDAKLQLGIIKQSEYNKAFDELNKNALVEAMAMKNGDVARSEYFKKLQENVKNPLFNKSQAEFEKVQDDYKEELRKLSAQFQNGVVTEKKYHEELSNLSEKTALAASSIEGIGIEGQALIAAMQFNAKWLKEVPNIKPEERNSIFDYKKTESDILGEQLKIAEKYRDELQKAVKDGAKELEKELNTAMENVTSLSQALKIQQVKDDIKDLQKEINEGLYSGIKDIASSSDRMVSAFSNLRDVMNDVDATEWEKIMAVWNAMTSYVDALLSVVKMIENLTEVTKKLRLAKQAEIAVDTEATQQKVVNAATGMAADVAAAGVKKATATGEVAANTAVGASEAGKGAAKLPFPWNIIAIGGAIAAAIAAFATIPKFENGGIVGGTSFSGDNVLARVNSGEMILNRHQQSNLFKSLNSGNSRTNGSKKEEFKFRVSGTDLVTVISNVTNKKSKLR